MDRRGRALTILFGALALAAGLLAMAPEDWPVVGAVTNPVVFWVLFAVFIGLSIYGAVEWIRARPSRDEAPPLPPPTRLPRPLFSLLIEQHPAAGNLDGDRMVYFPEALFTELAGDGRVVRMTLIMPEREFLSFNEFQARYRGFEQPVRDKYMSNPVDIGLNRHGHIAFIHRDHTPTGVTETWTLRLRDPKLPHTYEIEKLGEWECLDDGTVRRIGD